MPSLLYLLRTAAARASLCVALLLVVESPVFLSAAVDDPVQLKLRVVDIETRQPVVGFTAARSILQETSNRWESVTDKEWTENTQGEALVEFPAASANGYTRRLVVRHPDYVPWQVAWWQPPAGQQGATGEAFPSEFTLELDRGIPVGGVVTDQDNMPQAGVRVHVLGNTTLLPRRTVSPLWPSAYSWDKREEGPFAVTDDQGRWRLPHFPRTQSNARFVFVRPDHSFVTFTTGGPDPDSLLPFRDQDDLISLAELLRTRAVTVLRNGLTIEGTIVGDHDQPLAGVIVSEFQVSGGVLVSRFVTGADGGFRLVNRPACNIVLVARTAGYAIKPVIISVRRGMDPVRIQMQLRKPLLARLLDGEGRPLTGAPVKLQVRTFFGGLGRFLEWEGLATDADGSFRWEDAPREPVQFDITVTNMPKRLVTLSPDFPSTPIVIRKEQTQFIRIFGAVVAADTGEPVPRFIVQSASSAGAIFNFREEGQAGKLDLKLPHSSWRTNYYPEGELQVLAGGFEPQVVGQINFYEGDREFRVALKRGNADIDVLVLKPDGKPAASAKVNIGRGTWAPHLNRPAEFQRPGNNDVQLACDVNGRLKSTDDTRNMRIAIAHPEGFTALSMERLRGMKEVRLLPWGRVEGVAMESGKPLARERITLTTHPLWPRPDRLFGLSYSAATSEDGRFTFDMVPPGDVFLCRTAPSRPGFGSIEYTHEQHVTVIPGETNSVTYGGVGRLVIGWARPSDPRAAVDWKQDICFLTSLNDAPPEPRSDEFVSRQAFEHARASYFGSLVWLAATQAKRRHALIFDHDGRFRITDTLPGTYELIIRLAEPSHDNRGLPFRTSKQIGYLRQKVIVPKGPLEEPFDLGTVIVPLSATVAQAKALPPFEALTLDGKPLRPADFNGKSVVVIFWASWCRATAEALPELRTAYEAFRSDSRVAMVGVSLDEKPAVAKAFAEKNDLPWATGWLDAAGQARAASVFGVKGTPTVLLFDREGRIVARDLPVTGLKATVHTALRGK